MYNPYIEGKQVYLRHPTEEDVEGKWHEWFSDEVTTANLVDRFWPNSRESQKSFYQSLVSGGKDSLVLSIVDKETDKHIGVCSLGAINWVHRYSDFAVVIGEKEFRKGSYAFESLSLLLRTAFLRLNIRVVKGGYVSSNEFTRQLMKVLRFREVGVYEQLIHVNGEYHDFVLVMLDRNSWVARHRDEVLSNPD
jgi:RimJ/RimL family protein N-acetyltransferase